MGFAIFVGFAILGVVGTAADAVGSVEGDLFAVGEVVGLLFGLPLVPLVLLLLRVFIDETAVTFALLELWSTNVSASLLTTVGSAADVDTVTDDTASADADDVTDDDECVVSACASCGGVTSVAPVGSLDNGDCGATAEAASAILTAQTV